MTIEQFAAAAVAATTPTPTERIALQRTLARLKILQRRHKRHQRPVTDAERSWNDDMDAIDHTITYIERVLECAP